MERFISLHSLDKLSPSGMFLSLACRRALLKGLLSLIKERVTGWRHTTWSRWCSSSWQAQQRQCVSQESSDLPLVSKPFPQASPCPESPRWTDSGTRMQLCHLCVLHLWKNEGSETLLQKGRNSIKTYHIMLPADDKDIWHMAGRKLCFYLYGGHTGSESHSLSSYSVPGHSWPPLADLWMIVRYRDCVATVALSVKHEIQPPLKSRGKSHRTEKQNDTEMQPCLISLTEDKTCGLRAKVMSSRSRDVLHSIEVRFQTLHPRYAFIWLTFWGSLH